MYTLLAIITCIVFGLIGYKLSKYYRRRITYMVVLSYLLIAILTFYIGVGTRLLSIFSFSIMMNQVLGGFFSGFTIGLLVKLRKGNVKA